MYMRPRLLLSWLNKISVCAATRKSKPKLASRFYLPVNRDSFDSLSNPLTRVKLAQLSSQS